MAKITEIFNLGNKNAIVTGGYDILARESFMPFYHVVATLLLQEIQRKVSECFSK
jgi:hypothetical protein